ncbi:unnamed protein product, partial [Cyprideis torosa]
LRSFPKYRGVCVGAVAVSVPFLLGRFRGNEETNSSSDEEEEEDDPPSVGKEGASAAPPDKEGKDAASSRQETPPSDQQKAEKEQKIPVPLVDYINNVIKFLEAILTNNATEDHCKEFFQQEGLDPLLKLLGLPNLPWDFPSSQSCHNLASVCKSVLNLAQEPRIFREGILHLENLLKSTLLSCKAAESTPHGSALLAELVAAPTPSDAIQHPDFTPLLHKLSAVHSYCMTFVFLCRTSQTEVRQMALSHWGSESGVHVISKLGSLYQRLVWESTTLLAVCNEDVTPPSGAPLSPTVTNRLLPPESRQSADCPECAMQAASDSNMVTTAMEQLSTDSPHHMEVDEGSTPPPLPPKGPAQKKMLTPEVTHQIKCIRPLLTCISRLGRVMAELFGILVKLSVGSPMRHPRRGARPVVSPPTPTARTVSLALAFFLRNSLHKTSTAEGVSPKYRLTSYISALSFAGPLLFDDKKQPCYLMLLSFLECNGVDSLFEAFHWALTCGNTVPVEEGLEHPDLPEGTGEFLDVWLLLMERLCNTKTVLEAQPLVTTPPQTSFNPTKYLLYMHRRAFDAVMKLWNRKPLAKYGWRITESMLGILCHILKGEKQLKEKLLKKDGAGPPGAAGTSTATGSDSPTARIAAPNTTRLRQLMDMGFSREHCLEAMRSTSTLEQATEFLLTHPSPAHLLPEDETDDNAQILSALLMSLGEDIRQMGSARAGPSTTPASGFRSHDGSGEVSPKKPAPSTSAIPGQGEVQPIDPELVDEFVNSALEGSLRLLDSLPETVHHICELLCAIVARNGDDWRDSMIRSLMDEILEATGMWSRIVNGDQALMSEIPRAAVRLHLFALLFERMRMPCARIVSQPGCRLIDSLATVSRLLREYLEAHPEASLSVSPYLAPLFLLLDLYEKVALASQRRATVLEQGQRPGCRLIDSLATVSRLLREYLEAHPEASLSVSPYLAPLFLLLDLYEKVALASQRRATVLEQGQRVWKWFDANALKWCSYVSQSCKILDEAYLAGEPSVQMVFGNKRYTVSFHSMTQISEDMASRRPVGIFFETNKKEAPAEDKNKPSTSSAGPSRMSRLGPLEPSWSESPGRRMAGIMAMVQSGALGESAEEEEEEAEVDEPPPDGSKESEAASGSAVAEVIPGLQEQHKDPLLRACVKYLSLPLDPDTLHALLRLILRLTHDHDLAVVFAESGGVRSILQMTESSGFPCFNSLATLIVRSVVEDLPTLKYAMEKAIRSTIPSHPNNKDFHCLMRALAGIACRKPDVFTELMNEVIEPDVSSMEKRGFDSNRLLIQQVLAPSGIPNTCSTPLPTMKETDAPAQVVIELMEFLALQPPNQTKKKPVPVEEELKATAEAKTSEGTSGASSLPPSTSASSSTVEPPTTSAPPTPSTSTTTTAGPPSELSRFTPSVLRLTRPMDLFRHPAMPMSLEMEAITILGVPPSVAASPAEDPTAPNPAPPPAPQPIPAEQLLISKSNGCRMLAEMSRSYAWVPRLVAEYTVSGCIPDKEYSVGPGTTFLTFVLDHLVPSCQSIGDRETPAFGRLLLSAIGAASHCPEAQALVVGEVRAALLRALALPEGSEKHARIQSLSTLISDMISISPMMNHDANAVRNGGRPTMTVNNVVKLFLRKGVLTDLARVTYGLDLTSPNMAGTVNAALKPLDTLSRLINVSVPGAAPPGSMGPKESRREETSAAEESGVTATTTGADRAQGEEVAEEGDADNTEHDLSVTVDISTASERTTGDLVGLGMEEERDEGGRGAVDTLGEGESVAEMEEDHVEGGEEARVVPTGGSQRGGRRGGRRLAGRRRGQARIVMDDDDEHEALVDGFLSDILQQNSSNGRRGPQRSLSDLLSAAMNTLGAMEEGGVGDRRLDDSQMDHSEGDDEDEDVEDYPRVGEGTEDEVIPASDGEDVEDEVEVNEVGHANEDDAGDTEEEDDYEEDDEDDEEDEEDDDGEDDDDDDPDEPVAATAGGTGVRDRGNGWLFDDDSTRNLNYPEYVVSLLSGSGGDLVPNAPERRLTSHLFDLPAVELDVASGTGDLRAAGSSGSSHHQSAPPSVHPLLTESTAVSSRTPGTSTSAANTGDRFPTASVIFTTSTGGGTARTRGRTRTVVLPSIFTGGGGGGGGGQGQMLREARIFLDPWGTLPFEAALELRDLPFGNGMFFSETLGGGGGSISGADGGFGGGGQGGGSGSVNMSGGVSFSLTSLPTAGSRWIEGSRVVDGESVNDGVLSLVPGILPRLNAVVQKAEEQKEAEKEEKRKQEEKKKEQAAKEEIEKALAAASTATEAVTAAEEPTEEGAAAEVTTASVEMEPPRQEESEGPGPEPETETSQPEPVGAPSPLETETQPTTEPPTAPPAPFHGPPEAPSEGAVPTPTAPENPFLVPLPPQGAGAEETTEARRSHLQRTASSQSSLCSASEEFLPSSEEYFSASEGPLDESMPPPAPLIPAAPEPSSTAPSTGPPADWPQEGEQPEAPSSRASLGEYADILGDIEIPEGVDPSFLAALPEDMRNEVINEQLRLQRIRQRTAQLTSQPRTTAPPTGSTSSTTAPAAAPATAPTETTASASATAGPSSGVAGLLAAEVNQEFLDALPPSIQEEVLAQHRLEQHRVQSQQQGGNPEDSMDAATFLETLPPSLRQSVLADMEESQFSVLTQDLAAEAQQLRRQMEARRATMHERIFSAAQDRMRVRLYPSGRRQRRPTLYYSSSAGGRQSGFGSSSFFSLGGGGGGSGGGGSSLSGNTIKLKGRQLLDTEALTSLLILLFVDDQKLNTHRLHRIIKHLCMHGPTRDWVIKALLSILDRCTDASTGAIDPLSTSGGSSGRKSKGGTSGLPSGPSNMSANSSKSDPSATPSWLSLSLDAALGCKANVFQVSSKPGSQGKKGETKTITIHPQASSIVCRHVLDLLTFLAKFFPYHFLPGPPRTGDKGTEDKSTLSIGPKSLRASASASSMGPATSSSAFWEILLKMDASGKGGKGKGVARSSSLSESSLRDQEPVIFTQSPIGQLIAFLGHPVIRRSSGLTDKLLRLLGSLSESVADPKSMNGANKGAIESLYEVPESLLKLTVTVLTSKSCSEEGLEDATALLLYLAKASPVTRKMVQKPLIEGARELGSVIKGHVERLMQELREVDAGMETEVAAEEDARSSSSKKLKGVLEDRFSGQEVVVVAPAKNTTKTSTELQLPSMAHLTSKTSSQAFFLRILKVIVQLKEAIQDARTSATPAPSSAPTANATSTPLTASPSATEAQNESNQNQERQQEAEGEATSDQAAVPETPAEGNAADQAMADVGESQADQSVQVEPMEVDEEATAESASSQLICEQLQLDDLWESLSECLSALAKTHDHHAVLVLQFSAAKAVYDNKLLECYFTRAFYKHILGKHVRVNDMESEDYSFYQGLVFLMEHEVSELGYDVDFSLEINEFGKTEVRDLIPNGRNIQVTEENKMEYIRLVCQEKLTGAIKQQALRSFDQAERAKFLQFVTGTSKVPLQGFGALEGMNGVQKFQIHRDDRSIDRLPSAHTCFNQLDLPPYETYDKLRTMLLKAVQECSEGFGFA